MADDGSGQDRLKRHHLGNDAISGRVGRADVEQPRNREKKDATKRQEKQHGCLCTRRGTLRGEQRSSTRSDAPAWDQGTCSIWPYTNN